MKKLNIFNMILIITAIVIVLNSIFSAIFFAFFDTNKINTIVFVILLNLTVIAGFTYAAISTNICMQSFYTSRKNELLSSSKLIRSLIKIIAKSIQSIDNMIYLLDYTDNKGGAQFVTLDKQLEELIVLDIEITKIESMVGDLNSKTSFLEIDNAFNKFCDLNFTMYILTETIINDYENIVGEIGHLRNINTLIMTNLSKMLFVLKNSMPILSDIAKRTDEYTLEIIQKIFAEFEEVSVFSLNIEKSTQRTIDEFMNLSNRDSLAYISNETKKIKNQFNTFYKSMQDLQGVSELFLNNSVNSLKEIEQTATTIEEISEKIKLISINVRIEAAHLDNKNSGFKVLGKDISNFATLTSKIAKDTHDTINNTIENIENLKGKYIQQMEEVNKSIDTMNTTIQPFDGIIENSYNKFKSVVNDLKSFSNNITTKIKQAIGNLQYHDVTSQESNHIIQYISNISDFYYFITKDIQVDNNIDSDEREQINTYIIDKLDKMITTENERKIIQKYADTFGVKLAENSVTDELDGVNQIDEGTILF